MVPCPTSWLDPRPAQHSLDCSVLYAQAVHGFCSLRLSLSGNEGVVVHPYRKPASCRSGDAVVERLLFSW